MAQNFQQRTAKQRTRGFDRAVAELNAFLMVLAIGLGVLDATCFVALKVRDGLPAAGIGATALNPEAMIKTPPLEQLMPSRPTMGW